MKKHHINRLEKLYAFLGTVEPEKFDFSIWATANGDTAVVPKLNACGTTACALGWAGSMPEFRKRGLKLIWDKDHPNSHVMFTDRDGERYFGEIAGEAFFGLTENEAYHLFIPESYAAETMPLSQYRRRLRKFIDRKKRELKIK